MSIWPRILSGLTRSARAASCTASVACRPLRRSGALARGEGVGLRAYVRPAAPSCRVRPAAGAWWAVPGGEGAASAYAGASRHRRTPRRPARLPVRFLSARRPHAGHAGILPRPGRLAPGASPCLPAALLVLAQPQPHPNNAAPSRPLATLPALAPIRAPQSISGAMYCAASRLTRPITLPPACIAMAFRPCAASRSLSSVGASPSDTRAAAAAPLPRASHTTSAPPSSTWPRLRPPAGAGLP